MRGNSCLHLGGLRVNCGLPIGCYGGVNLDGLHVCMNTAHLFAVAGCGNCSPSANSSIKRVKCSCTTVPLDHSFVVNLGFNFWLGLVQEL